MTSAQEIKCDDGWYEVGAKETKLPTGYAGNLDADQEKALRQMWSAYFSICAQATGKATAADAGKGANLDDDSPVTEKSKKAGKDDSKEADEAKAREKQAAEQAKMQELLKAYGPDALHDAYWAFVKTDNPDTNMLRFLRARKWDIPKAIAMLAACLKWRLDVNMSHISERGDLGNGKAEEKFAAQQNSGKIFAGGCNAVDQPICYIRMEKHNMFAQSQACMKLFIFAQLESWRSLFVPPNDKIILLFDCTKFPLKGLDIPAFLVCLGCLESYFPESLGCLYLHNAPWVVQKAWAGIKGLLDPVVRSKVRFTNGDKELLQDIPSDRLYDFVGGDVKSDLKYVAPKEGENELQNSTVEKERFLAERHKLTVEFEEITKKWCEDPDNFEVSERRRLLAKKLRIAALRMDPYVRGLNLYDRIGLIRHENPGIVVWPYELKDGKKIRQVVGHKQCLKTLLREVEEIENKKSTVDEAEHKTQQMLEDGTWGRWDTLDYPATTSGAAPASNGAAEATVQETPVAPPAVAAAAVAA